jgi:hypothetical protein
MEMRIITRHSLIPCRSNCRKLKATLVRCNITDFETPVVGSVHTESFLAHFDSRIKLIVI